MEGNRQLRHVAQEGGIRENARNCALRYSVCDDAELFIVIPLLSFFLWFLTIYFKNHEFFYSSFFLNCSIRRHSHQSS